MQFTKLHTTRLVLTLVTQKVLDYVYAQYTDAQLMEFFGLASEALEQERYKHTNGLCTFNKTILYFTLTDKNTGKVIGYCGYHTWYTDHNRAEIFYGLHNDAYKQQGIITEALNTIIPYGFNEMKLHRIEAMTATYNIASNKTLTKFGFIQEGVLREHYLVDGVMEDSLMFSLLKHEYTL
ncbi:GNAT family N-acetyltransferase [Flavobacterium psychrotrophum]|uniref:GNAT family N-acetyltransferase n=1 Tax=Flavobacterium psychrotrophum TaxID=2294119 RepID=UPI000E31F68F|nr:GNAT family protein [Flavobacterium psychrotrophum]